MLWFQYIKKLNKKLIEYHKRDLEEQREHHKRKVRIKMQHDSIVRKKNDLKKQLVFLKHIHHNEVSEDQIELMNKIAELDTQIKEFYLKMHLSPFNSEDDTFNDYYRHIRYTRPFILIFNLLLWFVLFRFGGIATGLKIVVLVFALMTTFGSIFEMFFLMQIKERILKPIDSLIQGVNEIAQGNNEVRIKNEATSEISSLIHAFNEMAEKLREGEKLKAEYEDNRKALLANISHDLKTPITSIQGYIEMITGNMTLKEDGQLIWNNRENRQELDKYLKIIYSNADYMNRLIDDLFLFSKLDMQKLDFHFEEVSLRPFIKDMMEEFSLDLYEKNAEFEYKDFLSGNYIIKLDAKRFYQIIRNIISNAVVHGHAENLAIVVTLYEKDESVCINISDSGPGILPEHLEHIFERFYRVTGERTKNLSSTGLGLAIAKELVQAHGGDITVSSKMTEGTSFTISLPYLIKNTAQTKGD